MVQSNPGDPIQALVIGPGSVGLSVLRQLNKNTRFSVTWIGKEVSAALEDISEEERQDLSIVRSIDLEKTATPMQLNSLVDELKPDIVFLCQRGPDWEIENQVGSANLERNMLDESLRMVDAPIISVSLEQDSTPG